MRLLLLTLPLLSLACASTPARKDAEAAAPQAQHGKVSNLSNAKTADARFCQHEVPAENCVQCRPELVEQFKAVGDWCGEHAIPESQCRLCHPDLTFAPIPDPPEGADIAVLSKAGEDVESLDAHAAAGKVTVFDFYADWCAPCREVDAQVIALLHERDDVAWRKLNVVNWESPLAKRHLAEVPNLPYVVVYGKNGALVEKLVGVDAEALRAAIAKGAEQ